MFWLIIKIIISLIVSFILQIFIHETGHLLAGWLVGCRFVSFQVFGWLIKKEGGHIRILKYRLPSTLGQCLMAPPAHPKPKDAQIYEWGGSALNLATGLAALCWHHDLFMVMFGIAGIFSAMTQGIPMKGMVANDGSTALVLKNSADARNAFWKQLKINAESASGRRLNEMDPGLFTWECLDDPLSAVIPLFSAQRKMEAFQFSEAIKDLDLVMESAYIVPVQKQLARVDLITCYIAKNEPDKAARQYKIKSFTAFMEQMEKFPNVWRMKALYARFVDKDESASTKAMEEFEKTIKGWPNPVEGESEREIIDHIMKKAGL